MVFPELPYGYGDVAAADLDADGDQDLALAIHGEGLAVLLGDGKGSFTLQASFLDAAGATPTFFSRAIVAGDFDGDGRPDLAAMGEGPVLKGGHESTGTRLLVNGLPAPWAWRELHPATRHIFGDALVAADFDADGHLDLATASFVQGQRQVVFWGEEGAGLRNAELEALPQRAFVDALAAGDVDGEGGADLAIAFTLPQEDRVGVDLFVATHDRVWKRQELPWPGSAGRPTALAMGDPDGDGDEDLVALSELGAVVVLINKNGKLGRGAIIAPRRAGNGCRGYHVDLADLDNDGRDELIAAFADESCPGGGGLRAWRLRSRSRG